MRYKTFFFIAALGSLYANTLVVQNSGDSNTSGTLRYALLNANSGDTITFDPSVTSILLTNSLPAITQSSLTITAPTQVTIDGQTTYGGFVLPAGTLTLENLYITNCRSLGGKGGDGNPSGGGGGGGAGGGGGLYVHTGCSVTLNGVGFDGCQAVGGDGGSVGGGPLNSGGGGGGFNGGNGGDGTNSGAGGGGGGGGGYVGGGNGGSNAVGGNGGSAGLGIIGGGGGGGSGGNRAGGSCLYNIALPPYSGGAGGSNAGGGGGGMAGNGASPISTVNAGGGGLGIGADSFFGGGGGGGNRNSPGNGGSGWGGGGGGGAYQGIGGPGGDMGGGGGAAGNNATATAGNGGFGGGGGGSTGTGGSSPFAGGSGGSGGSATTGGGGGGGGAMGGAIFVHAQSQITIGDSTVNRALLVNNSVTAGNGGVSVGGASTAPGSPGIAYGPDLFIRSGGTVTFTISNPLLISTNIQGNQGAGDLSVQTGGGLIMNGTGTLTLGTPDLTTGINTYTSSTTILSGTVQIYQNANLGDTTLGTNGNSLTIQNGTLLTMNSFTCPRTISLTGSASINANSATTLTLTGPISGSGSLTKQGEGVLFLNPIAANTYSGETTVAQGTLRIAAVAGTDSALGSSNKKVTLQDQTIFNTVDPGGQPSIQSSRPFVLEGQATFQIDNANTFLAGTLSGSGGLIKTGAGTLILSGNNSYTGSDLSYATDLEAGILVGSTSSLVGDIFIGDGTTLIFLQPEDGVYSKTFTSGPLATGVLQIGNSTLSPFPLLEISSANPNFLGQTHIFPSGTLNVTGSMANSPFLIDAGGFLKGTGTVGPLTNSGTVQPGGSIGTLTVNGNLLLNASSNFVIEITSTTSSLLQVLGNAALNGELSVTTDVSGFYGLGTSYTILTNTGAQSGTFSSFNINTNFTPSITYDHHAVFLNLKVDQPFLDFPYQNPNEKSVGENLDALVASGSLTSSTPLGQAINSLIGLSNDAVNNALDQMHPAAFSAFAEIQAATGGQLLSLFHRRPIPHCVCSGETRFWIEPYANWLKEKNVGYELGFNANLKGTAVGFDTEITDGWSIGIGAAWNKTHMQWREGRGRSTILGYYAAAYMDYVTDHFYIGLSCLQGFDNCTSSRHINFSTVHEAAHATRRNRETIGQLALAAFFGPGACFAFPYLNIDYLYLKEGKAQESGAPGLNLTVDPHSSSTLRSEAGFAVQVQDTNKNSTMCISPLFGLGWAMEMPLSRPTYTSTFEDQTIPFRVQGWDYTWQLFTLRFGFTITYKCASIYGGYTAEMSPLESTPFFDQRGDIRLELTW